MSGDGMNGNDSLFIIADLLILKYGRVKIIGLLTDKFYIEKTREEERRRPYIRRLKNEANIFRDFDHDIGPDLLLEALEDAAESFNYSNWHGDKFDRAEEIIIRYCEEKGIPLTREIKIEEAI